MHDYFIAAFANKPKIVLLIFQFGLVDVIQDDVVSRPKLCIWLGVNHI